MPAPRASKAQIRNAVDALREAGLNPGGVVIHPDGRIEVSISGSPVQPLEPRHSVREDLPTWGDVS